MAGALASIRSKDQPQGKHASEGDSGGRTDFSRARNPRANPRAQAAPRHEPAKALCTAATVMRAAPGNAHPAQLEGVRCAGGWFGIRNFGARPPAGAPGWRRRIQTRSACRLGPEAGVLAWLTRPRSFLHLRSPPAAPVVCRLKRTQQPKPWQPARHVRPQASKPTRVQVAGSDGAAVDVARDQPAAKGDPRHFHMGHNNVGHHDTGYRDRRHDNMGHHDTRCRDMGHLPCRRYLHRPDAPPFTRQA